MPTVPHEIGEHRFEWDPDKNEKNELKHGVCFECAADLWAKARDCGYRITDKPGKPHNEEIRIIAKISGVFAPSDRNIEFKILYTMRPGNTCRIIHCIFEHGKNTSNVVPRCNAEFCSRDAGDSLERQR
jgi:uncharacterized DUF497 family protein